MAAAAAAAAAAAQLWESSLPSDPQREELLSLSLSDGGGEEGREALSLARKGGRGGLLERHSTRLYHYGLGH